MCEQTLPTAGGSCSCGFNAETSSAELAIERLQGRRKIARRRQAVSVVLIGMLLTTISLWISGGMSAYGYVPILVNAAMAAYVGLRARRERSIVDRQLAAARTFGQLPPARIIE